MIKLRPKSTDRTALGKRTGESTPDLIQREAAALDLGTAVGVRISRRARRVGLRIDEAGRCVVLILPPGTSARSGLRFLAAQRGWIATRLAASPQRVPLVEGAVVPVMGAPHRIRRELDPAAPPAAIAGGEIRVRGDPAHLPRRVRDHLVATARRE